VLDSFLLLKKIYKIPEESFKNNLDELTELLDLASFMDRPVRQISLGQRMRADLAASLLHDPEVLFLDEPTIGLDVVAKYQIRRFIRKTQEEKRMTVILTTHDMKDIEEICDRIIMIDKGKLVMDMRVNDIRKKLNSTSKVTVTFERDQKQVDIPLTSVLSAEGQKWILSYNKHEISTPVMISKITGIAPISDISIEEPDIEDIIRDIYTGAITL
jgi:ABC-2 type transport system ATP-binding protein